MDVWSDPCAQLVGAVRHHRHFVEDEAARLRLAGFCERIRGEGVRAFFDAEYPSGGGKAIIVNEAQGRLNLVDGNAHLVALVACDEHVTLADLVREVGRDDFVRTWRDGWEAGSGQEGAYDVYIPMDADASRIPGCREGTDWFKSPPQPTKIISADIAFDSPLFAPEDRGRPLGETARALGLLPVR